MSESILNQVRNYDQSEDKEPRISNVFSLEKLIVVKGNKALWIQTHPTNNMEDKLCADVLNKGLEPLRNH